MWSWGLVMNEARLIVGLTHDGRGRSYFFSAMRSMTLIIHVRPCRLGSFLLPSSFLLPPAYCLFCCTTHFTSALRSMNPSL